MCVVGYSTGYSFPDLECNGKEGVCFTLKQCGQYYFWSCMGEQYTDPTTSFEVAISSLRRKLYYNMYVD